MPKTVSNAVKRRVPRKAAKAKEQGSEQAKGAAGKAPTAKKKAVRKKTAAAKKPTAAKKTTAPKKTAAKRPRKTPRAERKGVAEFAATVLDEMKAQDIRALDVRHLTSVTDTMIVAAGRSDRHVRAIADALIERCKAAGYRPLGVEGQDSGEWVLVDLGDAIVHVMLPRAREFYNIESLWDIAPRAAAES